MSCIHTSQCSFSEGFFPVLIWGYFLSHHSPKWAPKYHFAEHKITELANFSKKGRVELCVMKSHIRKQSLSKLLSSYYLRIPPFSPFAPCAPKYHFAESTTTVLANCFKKGRVELCDEVTYQKAMSQKASLQLFSEDISFFTTGLNVLPIMPL